jgi:hypothetical protein
MPRRQATATKKPMKGRSSQVSVRERPAARSATPATPQRRRAGSTRAARATAQPDSAQMTELPRAIWSTSGPEPAIATRVAAAPGAPARMAPTRARAVAARAKTRIVNRVIVRQSCVSAQARPWVRVRRGLGVDSSGSSRRWPWTMRSK